MRRLVLVLTLVLTLLGAAPAAASVRPSLPDDPGYCGNALC